MTMSADAKLFGIFYVTGWGTEAPHGNKTPYTISRAGEANDPENNSAISVGVMQTDFE